MDSLNTGNAIVDVVGRMDFQGNVIPFTWYYSIAKDDKAQMLAINILADIVYWYRPMPILDEYTGNLQGFKKKFKADLLQRSYESLAQKFNCSKRQATEAIKFLETLGVIERVFRSVKKGDLIYNNVLFIKLNPEKLKELTYINIVEDENMESEDDVSEIRGTSPEKKRPLPQKKEIGPSENRETNTEITTKNTTKITTNNTSYCSERSDEPSKQEEETEPLADVEAIVLNTGAEWKPTQKQYEKWCRLYPNVNVKNEIGRMSLWCDENKPKRKTISGVGRFVNGWLDREQNKYHNNNQTVKKNSEGEVDEQERIIEELRKEYGCST